MHISASVGAGSTGRKSDAQVQKRGSTEDAQAQNQGNADQSQGLESNATMANAQENDDGMNKEIETGAPEENGKDKQGTETIGGGQPTEESSNANVSQQQQETSQLTGENEAAPPAVSENQEQAEGQKTEEGEQKPEEETKP